MEIVSKFDKSVYSFNDDSEINLNLKFVTTDKINKVLIQHGFVFYNNLCKHLFKKGIKYQKSNEMLTTIFDLSGNDLQKIFNMSIPIHLPLLMLKYSGVIPYVKVTVYHGFYKKTIKKIKLDIQFDQQNILNTLNSEIIEDLYLLRNKKLYSIVSDLNQIIFKSKKENYKKKMIKLLDRVDAILIETKDESEKRNLKEIYKFIEKIYSGKNIHDNLSIDDVKRLIKDISLIEKQEQIDKKLNESDLFMKLPIFNEFLSGEIHKVNVDYLGKETYNYLKSKLSYFDLFVSLGNNKNYLKIHNSIASLIGDSRIFYVVMGIITYVVIQLAYKINFGLYISIILFCFSLLIIVSGFYYFNLTIQRRALRDIQNHFISLRFRKNKYLKSNLKAIVSNGSVGDLFDILKLSNLPIGVDIKISIYLEAVLRTWYLNKDTGRNESNDETIYIVPIFHKNIVTKDNTYNLENYKLEKLNGIEKLIIPIEKITKNKIFKQNKTSRIFYRFIIKVNS
ncbi:MAG: hypothetical protein V3575_04280, partial [Candidatus Absconditabacteria bacterium]